MSLCLLLALLLLGLVLTRWKYRRSGRVICALAAIVFLLEGCGPLPAWLLARLQAPVATLPVITWQPRNAIVLLGAATLRAGSDHAIEPTLFAYPRIVRAVELYRSCKQSGNDCKLEITGGDPVRNGISEADDYSADILRLGVAPTDLLREQHSMNTWQNAQFSKPILDSYAPQQVLLVSSGTHLRRASLYFKQFGIHAVPVRAEYLAANYSMFPLFWNFAVTDVAVHEFAGIVQFHVYNAMGWNAGSNKAGAP